ncbi:MAG: carboxypeptidase-like regulatory domain-containing protein [Terracidiphilus sp.]
MTFQVCSRGNAARAWDGTCGVLTNVRRRALSTGRPEFENLIDRLTVSLENNGKQNKCKFGGKSMMLKSRIAFVVLSFILCAGMAMAQIKSSTITGTVTDQKGAVVAGANITVTETNTGVSATSKTNAVGDYTVPYLALGTYTVTVQAANFETYRKTDIVMASDTTVRVDARLTVGNVTQTVEIKASTAVIQSENATVQGSIGADFIMDNPNINDNPLYYAGLQAGVVPAAQMYNTRTLGVGYGDRIQFSAMRINGGEVGTNDVQIDGISVQGAAWHESTQMPNSDSLQEVSVETNNLSAALGGGQGVVSITTKSGTNALHGDVSYKIRNEQLNANGLSNNMRGVPRGKYRVNEWAGGVGGPVILPKLFNGKDKLFFFVSYSHLSNAFPNNGYGTVPTTADRTGDFSADCIMNNSGNPVHNEIFDPYSAVETAPGSHTFLRTEYPHGTGTCIGDGLHGDMVTPADTYGLKILSAYPAPNVAPSDDYGDNNFYFSGNGTTTRDNLSGRMDIHLLPRNSLYLSGGVQKGNSQPPVGGGWGPGPWFRGGTTEIDNDPYAAIGDTISINPTTFADIRYGVERINSTYGFPPTSGYTSADYSSYGMPTSVQNYIALPGSAPSIGGMGYDSLNLDGWARKTEHQLNHTVTGSVTKLLGKWTMREGAEYRVDLGNWADIQFATPEVLAAWGPDSNTEQYGSLSGGGNSLDTQPQQNGYFRASAAVGAQGWNLSPGSTAKPALASKYLAFYSQNDWKATRKLTVNLGLRYEIQPGPTERHNRMSSLDLTVPNPYAASLPSGLNPLAGMGAFVFPGQSGYSRNLWDTQWNNIGPRLGFAYMLPKSTVLRGGIGRIYTPSNNGFNANTSIYGTSGFAGGVAPIPYGQSPDGVPVGHFEDPQNTQIITALGAVQSPQLYGGSPDPGNFLRKGFKNGYVDQWNVFLERKLGGWLTSVGYVGSKGADLPWRHYPLSGYFSVPWTALMDYQNGWASSNGTNHATDQVPNPIPALIGLAVDDSGGSTVNAFEAQYYPYLAFLPEWGGYSDATVVASKGNSKYSALELSAKHSYSNGLTALITYTWSRATGVVGGATFAESQVGGSTGYSGGLDYRNPGNNKSLLAYDTKNRLVAAVNYELPIGKGKRLDPDNAVVRGVVGEWRVGTVVTLQSGMPWGPNCGSENGRCIPTGQALELPKSYQHWYDGSTSVTLPDGRIFTPPQYSYLKWNPDAFTSQLVQWADGSTHEALYWLGTTPMTMDSLRMPTFQNVNLSINRRFPIWRGAALEFLADATNLFNRTNVQASDLSNGFSPYTYDDPAYNAHIGQNSNAGTGTMGTSFYDPRQFTFTLRLNY